jgi:hypothetical protein
MAYQRFGVRTLCAIQLRRFLQWIVRRREPQYLWSLAM